jgi:hypothetical protein
MVGLAANGSRFVAKRFEFLGAFERDVIRDIWDEDTELEVEVESRLEREVLA